MAEYTVFSCLLLALIFIGSIVLIDIIFNRDEQQKDEK